MSALEKDYLSLGRIGAFSDGVFAFAINLIGPGDPHPASHRRGRRPGAAGPFGPTVEDLPRLRAQLHEHWDQLDEPPNDVLNLQTRRPYPRLAQPPVPDGRGRLHARPDGGPRRVAGRPPTTRSSPPCSTELPPPSEGLSIIWFGGDGARPRQAHFALAVLSRGQTAGPYPGLGSGSAFRPRAFGGCFRESRPGGGRFCDRRFLVCIAASKVVGDGAAAQYSKDKKIGSIIPEPRSRRDSVMDNGCHQLEVNLAYLITR